MQFLVDAQLPPALAAWIAQRGHCAKAVREVGLRGADDPVIWDFSVVGTWVMVTKDEDFAERALRTGTGPQIVWRRIGNCTNHVLFAWLEPLWPSVIQQLEAEVQVVEVSRTL